MRKAILDITSLAALEEAAETVLRRPAGAPRGSARVLALHGDLGAGKTAFAQALGRALGVSEPITSPTFVIMKRYATTDPLWRSFVHIDAYRLESAEELQTLGFAERLQEADTILAVEWAERVEELLPTEVEHLYFTATPAGRRLELSST